MVLDGESFCTKEHTLAYACMYFFTHTHRVTPNADIVAHISIANDWEMNQISVLLFVIS